MELFILFLHMINTLLRTGTGDESHEERVEDGSSGHQKQLNHLEYDFTHLQLEILFNDCPLASSSTN